MTKLVKLSLAAAIAVSGLSSTVAAKPLEEAIKGVDVSGTVVYRYDDRNDDENTGTRGVTPPAGDNTNFNTNSYKAVINVKVPVNDIITFNTRIGTGVDTVTNSDGLSPASLETSDNQDSNPSLNLSEAYFTAKMGMLTVNAGKQGIASPWTVAQDAMGNDQTGTGIVALADAGFATFAAAYFNQHNMTTANTAGLAGTEDIAAIAVIAPVGPVNVDVWYLDMEDTFDSYTVGLSTSLMGINGYIRYTDLDLDGTAVDNNAWEAGVSGDLGPVGLALDYGNTDDEGGLVALDCDATTGIQAWAVNACGKADADYWKVQADMDLMPGLNFALTYAEVDYDSTPNTANSTDVEEDEVYGQLTYQMSDNFMTYVRYGTYDVDSENNANDVDQTRGRLHVQYSF